MLVTYHQFQKLSFPEQLHCLWTHGTFLTWRWETVSRIGIYHLPGNFFCELHLNLTNHNILAIKSFSSSLYLNDYISSFDLSTLFN